MHYGKYRAFVVECNDPLKRGRVKVHCPRISKDYISDWAEICTPFSFKNGGMHFELVKHELVWVEFEEGNLDRPIVTGCIWSSNEAPLTGVEGKRIIITPSGHTLLFDDTNNLIRVECKNKNKILLDPKGIEIVDFSNNKILMNDSGISITDTNGNKCTMNSSGVKILGVDKIDLEAPSEVNIKASTVNVKCSSMNVD